jgi:hypothetical protein
MVAAAGASLAYQPARAWLSERANRLVYGDVVLPTKRFELGHALDARFRWSCCRNWQRRCRSMQLRSAQI